jgi:hypothetical protein
MVPNPLRDLPIVKPPWSRSPRSRGLTDRVRQGCIMMRKQVVGRLEAEQDIHVALEVRRRIARAHVDPRAFADPGNNGSEQALAYGSYHWSRYVLIDVAGQGHSLVRAPIVTALRQSSGRNNRRRFTSFARANANGLVTRWLQMQMMSVAL